MSRYRGKTNEDNTFINDYKTNILKLLKAIQENTNEETLVIWGAEMPIGKHPNGKYRTMCNL